MYHRHSLVSYATRWTSVGENIDPNWEVKRMKIEWRHAKWEKRFSLIHAVNGNVIVDGVHSVQCIYPTDCIIAHSQMNEFDLISLAHNSGNSIRNFCCFFSFVATTLLSYTLYTYRLLASSSTASLAQPNVSDSNRLSFHTHTHTRCVCICVCITVTTWPLCNAYCLLPYIDYYSLPTTSKCILRCVHIALQNSSAELTQLVNEQRKFHITGAQAIQLFCSKRENRQNFPENSFSQFSHSMWMWNRINKLCCAYHFDCG